MVTVATQETGVVLWASPQRGVAVIWCTDQQRLAYYARPDVADTASDTASDTVAPSVVTGDLVTFSSRIARGLRLAEALRVIERGWHPNLAEALRDCPEEKSAPPRRVPHLRAV